MFNPFAIAVYIISAAIFIVIIVAALDYIETKNHLAQAARHMKVLEEQCNRHILELQKLNKAVIRRNHGIKALTKKLSATSQLSLNLTGAKNERQTTRNNSSRKRTG